MKKENFLRGQDSESFDLNAARSKILINWTALATMLSSSVQLSMSCKMPIMSSQCMMASVSLASRLISAEHESEREAGNKARMSAARSETSERLDTSEFDQFETNRSAHCRNSCPKSVLVSGIII